VRLLISDPLFYILGYWYGDAGVAWVEKRSTNFGGILRTWEQGFRKAAWPLVAIAPNNFICLFAGAAGMAPPVFVTLNIVGTAVRLYLIRIFGEAFESPIDDLLGFIRDYRLPLTALTASLVVITIVVDRRTGKGDLEALTHIEDELGTEEHPPEHPVGEPELHLETDEEGVPGQAD
jgi:membrane protein DedA with SNARE-associated domain